MVDNKKKPTDMTQGNPLPLLVRFAIPLILSALFQQLYTFVDTVIVGRCISVQALSAVGETDSVSFLILRLMMGCAIGFNIPLAQSFGAGDKEKLCRYFWNGLYLITFMGVALTLIVLPMLAPLLMYMNTPDELLGMALEYMGIIVIGMTATALYNYLSGALRAIGDSDHPFYFLMISSVVNLVLDLIFIMVFDMGVAGAAWATVISQALSAFLCGWWLFNKTGIIQSRNENGSLLKVSFPYMGELFTEGFPMGLNYSVTAIGIIAMQASINTLGAVAVAAYTVGEKIRRIITVPLESVGTAINTYAAQNYGAKRIDRIRKGISSGFIIQASVSVMAWVLLLFTKKPLVGILLGDINTPEAQSAVRYLAIVSTLFIFHGILMIFRNTLQGMGHGMLAMMSSISEIVGRVLCGELAVAYISFDIICVTNPVAWLLAGVYCLVFTVWYLKKEERAL